MYDIADGGTTNNGGIDFVEAGVDDFNPITDTQNPGPTININHIDSGSSSTVAFNNNNNIVYGYDSRINDVQNVNKCGSTGGLIDYQNSPKTVTMNFSGPLTFDPSIVGSSPTTMTDGFDIRGGVVVRGNRNSCDYDGYDYFEGLDYMNDWHHTPCYFSDCMDGGTWPFTITLTPQVATPIITPPTGTFTTAQSATISDSTSGATIYYTTNGTTPTTASPVYSKAFTVSSTTTVEAMAAASGYINSNVATSTIIINVPQSISMPQTLSLPIGTTPLVLDSSVVTASASCDPSSVTATVTVNDSNSSTTVGGSLASWTADSNHRTYGSISSGNTFSQSGMNIYTVKLTCGTATASSQLTVVDPAPTITAVSCSPSESSTACVVKSTGSFIATITGTNFIAGNYTTLAQWPGTDTGSVFGKCPGVMPSRGFGGDGWDSFTEISQATASNGASIGTWFYYVFNPPVGATTYFNDPTDPGGTGGGWNCLDNAYTVIANSSSSTSNGIATLEPGSTTVPGTLYLRSITSGKVVWQTSLDLGSTMVAVFNDTAYVPNKDAHSLSVIDLHNHTVENISTGDAKPWISAVSSKTGTPYVVVETQDGYNIKQYTEDGALLAMTSNGPQITDLLVDREEQLVYLVQHNNVTEIHRLNPSTGREEIMDLDTPANSLSLSAAGYFVYWTGEHHLTLIDDADFRQTVQGVLQSPIYTANGVYFGLSDGNIWEVKTLGGQIHPTLTGHLDENERFSGFVPDDSNGQTVFYAVPADEHGRLSGALAAHQLKAF
jgi:hypothetical protein